jgi:hypothetical protein
MIKFFALCLTLFSISVDAKIVSARRDSKIDFHEYLKANHLGVAQPGYPPAPDELAVPLSQLDLSSLPKWSGMDLLQKGFEMVRDHRFVDDDSRPGLLRRDTWLYPDDGCFARAALVAQNLHKWRFENVKKVFAFGNLTVKTANSVSGSVSWWYHVVTAASVDGQPYVLDPAIEPLRPLSLAEWVARMGGASAQVTLAICSSTSYTPSDACLEPMTGADDTAMADQESYLSDEWNRLLELKRDPTQELGDRPPWPLHYQ